jgi:hypothetical protein
VACAEKLPVLLHVRVVDFVVVRVRVCDVCAVHKDPDGRRASHGVAGAVAVSGLHRSDGVFVHMRVVRGWADGVPPVPHWYKPGACFRGPALAGWGWFRERVGVECVFCDVGDVFSVVACEARGLRSVFGWCGCAADDVRELPVSVRQQGEPLQPRVREQLQRDILHQDPGFEEPVQEQGAGGDSGADGGRPADEGHGRGARVGRREGGGRGAGVQGDVAERGGDGGRRGGAGDGGGPGEHGERAGDGDEGRVRRESSGGAAGAAGGGPPASVEPGAEERELGDHAGHPGDVVRGGGAGAQQSRAGALERRDDASRQSMIQVRRCRGGDELSEGCGGAVGIELKR